MSVCALRSVQCVCLRASLATPCGLWLTRHLDLRGIPTRVVCVRLRVCVCENDIKRIHDTQVTTLSLRLESGETTEIDPYALQDT